MRPFGHVLQHHRHEERLVVVIDKKLSLQRYNRLHDRLQRLKPAAYALDERLRCADLLPGIDESLLLTAREGGVLPAFGRPIARGAVHDERFGEGRAHSQLRQVAAVLRHDGIALWVDCHAEVGHHRRRAGATAFREHTAGTRIQVPDFAAHAFHVLVAQMHSFGDAVPARVDEVVVEALDHLTGLARSRQLQEQAVA